MKFGALSTRYKDVFDIYYLIDKIDARKLSFCFRSYIFDDPGMKENNMKEVVKRVQMTFQDKVYRRNLEFTDKNWTLTLDNYDGAVLNSRRHYHLSVIA